jgi:hypothetical protein
MHYLPNNAVSFDDEPSGLLVTFLDIYLSIRFYKDLDAGDNKIYLRTELYRKEYFGEPLVFGRVMDSEVKDGDRISAIRTAIEMGKNFDIAFGYERQLIKSNYETIKLG